MKIKKLWVSKYKNIEDETFEFKSDLISLLVGRNGLGKSNLIEILALIFRDLEMLERESDFNNWAYEEEHFEYDITYECRNSELNIICKEGSFEVKRRQKGTEDQFLSLGFREFRSRKKEEYLPKYIIGYYSGENKRIAEIINAHEEQVFNRLKDNEGLDDDLRYLFFAQNYHAQMVLLTLLLYKEQSRDGEIRTRIGRLVNEFCSFTGIESLDIEFVEPYYFNRRHAMSNLTIENVIENILEKKEFPFWGIKGKANKLISYFYNNTDNRNAYAEYSSPAIGDKNEHLVLDHIKYNDLAAGIYEEFGAAINFFDALESTSLIESLDKIKLKVNSKTEGVSFYFNQLSEGEQQLITALGLILIAGNDDCLFLLDEPDTHLNPKWQRFYVELLHDFNLNDDNTHMIVATHSPLIVQAADRADIFLFKRNAEGKVKADNNDDLKIHNWRIDQVLASEYFEFISTRPPALDEFMRERAELLSKPELTPADIEQIKRWAEDGDLLPSGETLNDFKAMQLVHTIAKEAQQQ